MAASHFCINGAVVDRTKNGKPASGDERLPVTNVSLDDAQKFAEWRSRRDGVTYRLPTEEEWEFAARGIDPARRYPWGADWSDGRANVDSQALKPVGSFPQGASPQGALDLIGNAWEWTSSPASQNICRSGTGLGIRNLKFFG